MCLAFFAFTVIVKNKDLKSLTNDSRGYIFFSFFDEFSISYVILELMPPKISVPKIREEIFTLRVIFINCLPINENIFFCQISLSENSPSTCNKMKVILK